MSQPLGSSYNGGEDRSWRLVPTEASLAHATAVVHHECLWCAWEPNSPGTQKKYDTPEKNELELGEHGNLKQFCNSNLWDLTEKIGNNCIDKRTSHCNLIGHACLWRQKSTGGWQNVNQDWAKKCWSSWVASAPHQNLKWFQNQLPLQWLLARGKFWAPKLRGFSIALSQMSSTLPRPSHGAFFSPKNSFGGKWFWTTGVSSRSSRMISASRSATYNKYTKYLAAVETESQAIRMTFFVIIIVTFSRCIEID